MLGEGRYERCDTFSIIQLTKRALNLLLGSTNAAESSPARALKYSSANRGFFQFSGFINFTHAPPYETLHFHIPVHALFNRIWAGYMGVQKAVG